MAQDHLEHAIEYFETLEGTKWILNVRTDLLMDPSSRGFNADKLNVLNRELAKRLPGSCYGRVDLHHSKSY